MAATSDSPRITLCGRLTVSWEGKQLERSLPGRQGRLIFAFLALNRGRPVRREELVEALWGDEGLPSGGESLLAPPLSRLRKALGPGRIEGRAELELALGEGAWIDWEAARDQVERAREALDEADGETAWEAADFAERVLAGGLLPGLEARWIDDHRRILDDLRLEALELIARSGARLAGPRLARAERAAREAVELSRFRESARAALLEVMEAKGNVAEALQAFEEFRVLLRDELGTFPAPELAAIHERLLNAHEDAPHTESDVTAAPDRGGRKATRSTRSRSTAELARLIDPRIGEIDLVGREGMVARLGEELDLAAAGELRIALLSGEGGLGKTRIAAELVASRDDITVLYGRAEQDEVRPLRIWTDLLRSAFRNGGLDPAAIVGGDGPTLARILPELVRRMQLDAPGPPGDLESERRALFDAVMRTIGRLSAVKPLLVVLDDLHWADRSTLMLLASLAGDNPPGGVLALGLYREDELPDDSLLLETVTNLQRRLPATRLELQPLSTEDVARLIEGRLDPALAERLRDQAGGNPFLVEQIARHLEEVGPADDGGPPPEAREIVMRRVDRLAEGSGELLARAALIGRDFDLAILDRTTPLDEDQVIALLDDAVAAGLLDESETVPGRYSFVHTLLRDALADHLSLTRRTRVHRDIGEAIEQHVRDLPERRLGELAWHFGLAGPGETDRAVSYSRRAAEQAESRLAYDEAVGFYSAAIAALTADEPVDQGLLANLLLGRAEAEWRLGHLGTAGESFFEAAAAARESGLPELLARAAIGTSWGSWEAFDVNRDDHIELLEEALALLGDGEEGLRARVAAHLSQAIYFGGRTAGRAIELVEEAMEIAGRLGDPAVEFEVLTASQFFMLQQPDRELRLATSDRCIEIAEESSDPEDLAEALAWHSVTRINAGLGAEAAADQARHTALNRTLPQITVANRAMRAVRCFIEGRWQEGEQITATWLNRDISASAAIAMKDALIYMVRAQQGRLAENLEWIEAQAASAAAWDTWPAWEYALMLGRWQDGQHDRAIASLELDRNRRNEPSHKDLLYLVFCGIASMVAAETRHAGLASDLIAMMRPHVGEWVIFGPAGSTFGPVDLLLGEMNLLTGSDREAATALENAVATCEEMSARPYLARAQLGLSEALGRMGDPDGRARRESLRASGAETARELGMAPLIARYRLDD